MLTFLVTFLAIATAAAGIFAIYAGIGVLIAKAFIGSGDKLSISDIKMTIFLWPFILLGMAIELAFNVLDKPIKKFFFSDKD